MEMALEDAASMEPSHPLQTPLPVHETDARAVSSDETCSIEVLEASEVGADAWTGDGSVCVEAEEVALGTVLTVLNGKGGSGTSTCSALLALLLADEVAEAGGRVLLLDCDAKGDSSARLLGANHRDAALAAGSAPLHVSAHENSRSSSSADAGGIATSAIAPNLDVWADSWLRVDSPMECTHGHVGLQLPEQHASVCCGCGSGSTGHRLAALIVSLRLKYKYIVIDATSNLHTTYAQDAICASTKILIPLGKPSS